MELRTRAAIVAIMAVLFAASCAHEQALARGKMTAMLPAAPAGYKWQMVPSLSDEFSGNTLDKSKWLPYQPYWPGRAPSQFDPKNVSEQGGCLLLKSTTTHDSLAGIADPNDDPWISSACVSSSTPRASYGYYEARVKASDLPMTSSFWFQGKYSEIDVVEQIGPRFATRNSAA